MIFFVFILFFKVGVFWMGVEEGFILSLIFFFTDMAFVVKARKKLL